MDILDTKYSAQEVVKAALVLPPTLQNWVNRGLPMLEGEHALGGGGARGKFRQFSFLNVMEICVAAALISLGVSNLKAAFAAAKHFAYQGEGELPDQPARMPGCPFKVTKGTTLLAFSGDRSELVHWTPGQDCLAVIRAKLGKPEGYIVLDVEVVFRRVVTALGADPAAVLTAAYSTGAKA